MPEEYILSLEELGVPVIKTKPLKKLGFFLDGHPDLAIHQVAKNTLVVDKTLSQYYKEKMPDMNILSSNKEADEKYPNNIGLNIFRFENYVFHNLEYMDEVVKSYYISKGYKLINVKQGYTKCSVAYVNGSILTSDKNIYEKARQYMNCLLIDHKQIKLKGFNYGFIGGASGSFNNCLILTGQIKDHSSKKDIETFAKLNNINIKYLSSDYIEDYGSILSIY